ncbi:MAG: putative lipid II flippase FtsW [Zetaproteobacteria bacterium]|nr:putative lipid II flippase FtsW [Zetaproteobacteria bacterium]
MKHYFSKKHPGIDLWIVGTTLALMCFGLIMVGSASLDVSSVRYDNPLRMIRNWVFYMPLGLLIIVVVSHIDIQKVKSYSVPILFVMMIIMSLLLIIGHETNGATRWYSIMGFSFQPVELFKPALILYMAFFISSNPEKLRTFKHGILPMLVVLSGGLTLLMLQPDFGNTMLLLSSCFCLWLVGGIPVRHLFLLIALTIPAIGAAVIFEPYRMLRLVSFIDPWADPYSSGYQLIQSMLAFGVGGIQGTGLGQGIQKLFYLPEASTDFIAAVIAEELGLLGIFLLIALFAILIWRGFRICLRSKEMFERLMALGCTLLIAISAIINMGVVMGLFPTKGMPLPFISYGGSALIGNSILIGILLGISRQQALASTAAGKPVKKSRAQSHA